MAFCKNCGNKLDEGSKFCSVCGYKTSENIKNIHHDDNRNNDKRTLVIASIMSLISGVILFCVLFVFSTNKSLDSAITSADLFYINVFDVTYLCVESVSHLFAFMSGAVIIALSIFALAKPKLINIPVSIGWLLVDIFFVLMLFEFSNFCFFIPAIPFIGILICSAIMTIVANAKKQ